MNDAFLKGTVHEFLTRLGVDVPQLGESNLMGLENLTSTKHRNQTGKIGNFFRKKAESFKF